LASNVIKPEAIKIIGNFLAERPDHKLHTIDLVCLRESGKTDMNTFLEPFLACKQNITI
jgi:hypothetical protein